MCSKRLKLYKKYVKKGKKRGGGNMIWSFRKEIVTSFDIQEIMTVGSDLGSTSYPPVLLVGVRNLC